MLSSVGLQRLYTNRTHVGAHTSEWSARQSLVNEDSQWPPTLGSLCLVTLRSAVSSWAPFQKDCIMYFPHTVVLLAAPLWMDTWQACPQMGHESVFVCGKGCCWGEGAQAEVTDWDNGADERQVSCLGFKEGDYWETISPSYWIAQRMVGVTGGL